MQSKGDALLKHLGFYRTCKVEALAYRTGRPPLASCRVGRLGVGRELAGFGVDFQIGPQGAAVEEIVEDVVGHASAPFALAVAARSMARIEVAPGMQAS